MNALYCIVLQSNILIVKLCQAIIVYCSNETLCGYVRHLLHYDVER